MSQLVHYFTFLILRWETNSSCSSAVCLPSPVALKGCKNLLQIALCLGCIKSLLKPFCSLSLGSLLSLAAVTPNCDLLYTSFYLQTSKISHNSKVWDTISWRNLWLLGKFIQLESNIKSNMKKCLSIVLIFPQPPTVSLTWFLSCRPKRVTTVGPSCCTPVHHPAHWHKKRI